MSSFEEGVLATVKALCTYKYKSIYWIHLIPVRLADKCLGTTHIMTPTEYTALSKFLPYLAMPGLFVILP